MKSIEMTFVGDGGVTLTGTLTLPDGKGPFAAVVCVHGSGNVDRDENVDTRAVAEAAAKLEREGKPVPSELKAPHKWNIFRDAAWALAGAGIACLRYDKRGTGKSGGDPVVRPATSLEYDVHAAVSWLRARPDIDGTRIGLLGHSEGGYLSPVLAVQDPTIKAIAFMGGPARSLRTIYLHQGRVINALSPEKKKELGLDPQENIEATFKRFVDAVDAGDEWIDDKRSPGGRTNLIWWRQHFQRDPVANIKAVKCPVMVLQGGKDYQVPAGEAELLRKALEEVRHPDYEVHVFPDLSHIMFPVEGVSDGSEYWDPTGHISAEVLGHLVRWYMTRL
jgi:uncharacterized protein